MTKRPSTAILLMCAAFGVACGTDTPSEWPYQPYVQPVFFRLEVYRKVVDLLAAAPWNTVQLSVDARDEKGAGMPGADAVTYSSSAPATASVSSSGVVTAVTPGTAVITATLPLGGITRTASMTATVHGRDQDGEMAGVYDLTALITSSDSAWGSLDGTRQAVVLTIFHSRESSQFAGTFADFRAIGPGGDVSSNPDPGFVSGTIDLDGHVVIELFSKPNQSSIWYGKGMLASRQIVGEFGCCGHIGGTFTAERR